MQRVLYSPVGSDPRPKHRQIQGFTPPEIPGLTRGGLDMTLGFHRSNGRQTGSALPFLHPIHFSANTGPAYCNTTMILCHNIGGQGRGMGTIRILPVQVNTLVQGSRVSLAGQHVLAVPFGKGMISVLRCIFSSCGLPFFLPGIPIIICRPPSFQFLHI